MKLSENDGTEKRREGRGKGEGRGRGEEASGPAYANPPRAASKSGRQAATAEEWAAVSHSERRCEGGNRGASEGMKKEGGKSGVIQSGLLAAVWYSWNRVFQRNL